MVSFLSVSWTSGLDAGDIRSLIRMLPVQCFHRWQVRFLPVGWYIDGYNCLQYRRLSFLSYPRNSWTTCTICRRKTAPSASRVSVACSRQSNRAINGRISSTYPNYQISGWWTGGYRNAGRSSEPTRYSPQWWNLEVHRAFWRHTSYFFTPCSHNCI